MAKIQIKSEKLTSFGGIFPFFAAKNIFRQMVSVSFVMSDRGSLSISYRCARKERNKKSSWLMNFSSSFLLFIPDLLVSPKK